MGDITRRASLLWTGRSQHSTSRDLGTHVPLGSQENISTAAMGVINVTPTPTPSPSPSPSARSFADLGDPFANPPEPVSPFADQYSRKVTPNTSLDVPPSPSPSSSSLLRTSSSPKSRVPPPRPLHLPSPRTPPPVDKAPRPTSPPSSTGVREPNESSSEPRWWHDWLCGCTEGPDRGGDSQVTISFVQINALFSVPFSFRQVVQILSSKCFSVHVVLMANLIVTPLRDRLPVESETK